MNNVYNGEFAPEFSASMLKEIIALVRYYVYENWKKSKTSGKLYVKLKFELFLEGSTKYFLQKLLVLNYFRSCQNSNNPANFVAEIH